MFIRLFYILKKIIMSAILLYAYNRFAISFNAIIPINLLTVVSVSFLGVPMIVGLVIFNIVFI